MRIDCLHGYFIFSESEAGDIARFAGIFELDVVQKDNYFTFAQLADAPLYSIKGGTYLGADATETFEGNPWQVMEANGLVYNFQTGEIVPAESITQRIKIHLANNYYFSPGLILPGSLTDEGERITGYIAHLSLDTHRFRYSGVQYA
jgi:hypothetical protein